MICLLAYFVLSALICGREAARLDGRAGWERAAFAVVMATLSPIIPLTGLAIYASEMFQLRTFWFFLFRRRRLVRTRDELDRLRRITLTHRATGSLHHRAWRLAERCYHIVNKYEPPKP